MPMGRIVLLTLATTAVPVVPAAAQPRELTEEDVLAAASGRGESDEPARVPLLPGAAPLVLERALPARTRVRIEARVALASLAAAQARESVLEALKARLTGVTEAMERREAAGDVAGFDRLRAERELAEVEARLATVAEERIRAQATLAALLGHVEPGELRAAALPEPSAAPLPPAAVVAAGPAVRGDALTAVRTLGALVSARRAAFERYRDAAVTPAGELEHIAAVSYENGVSGVLELLDALRSGAEARLELARLALELRRAEIELMELTGEELS